MEVRVRNAKMDGGANARWSRSYSAKDKRPSSTTGMIQRECHEMSRAMARLLKGEASLVSYVIIPVVIIILWLILCLFTTKNPELSLEERLRQRHFQEYFQSKLFDESQIDVSEETYHEHIVLPDGESVNVVMAMPFLDINPLGATEYIAAMEWILIYSSVPLTFHVITNTDSIPYVERVFERVNASTQLTFDHHIVTLASIMERMTNEICPQLGISSEDFCDVLMGKMTPLLFPFLFPDLNHVIYVDRNIRFQDDIGALFHVLVEVMGPTSAALAVAPEQTNLYMRAFSTWQRINPTTRLGRPPPEGRPGLNPDLILLDLRKLRTNTTYKTYFKEQRVKQLLKAYAYHTEDEIPSLGDLLNLMAADRESFFHNLGCEWNRNAKSSSDMLEQKFNVCPKVHHIRAWNGNPNLDRIAKTKEKGISVGKRRIQHRDSENELK